MNVDYASILHKLQRFLGKRQDAARALVLLAAAVFVAAFLGLAAMGDGYDRKAQKLEKRFARVASMVAEIQAAGDRVASGEFENMAPTAAVQQIVRDLDLDRHLTSVRPTQLPGGQEGVQFIVESLNLPQTLNLLSALADRGALTVASFSLAHRADNKQLADLQMLVTR